MYDNEIITNKPDVMNVWKDTSSSLCNTDPNGVYDEGHFQSVMRELESKVSQSDVTILNRPITRQEVLSRAKRGKATGVDCIPVEAL